jgi:hypothetical protein
MKKTLSDSVYKESRLFQAIGFSFHSGFKISAVIKLAVIETGEFKRGILV